MLTLRDIRSREISIRLEGYEPGMYILMVTSQDDRESSSRIVVE
jgi:hypothetical protein